MIYTRIFKKDIETEEYKIQKEIFIAQVKDILKMTEAGKLHWELQAYYAPRVLWENTERDAELVHVFEGKVENMASLKITVQINEAIELFTEKGNIDLSMSIHTKNDIYTYDYSLYSEPEYYDVSVERQSERYADLPVVKLCECIIKQMIKGTTKKPLTPPTAKDEIEQFGLLNLMYQLLADGRVYDLHRCFLDGKRREELLRQYRIT